MKFEKLLEPGRIGVFVLKNRILKMGSTLGFFLGKRGIFKRRLF